MFVRSRFSIAPIVVSLLVSTVWLGGCHKKEQPKQEQKSVDTPEIAAAKRSLEEIKTQYGEVAVAFSDLHHRLDALPQDLDGLAELRAKFFSNDETRGLFSAKLAWVASRIDAAQKSGKAEDLASAKTALQQASGDLRLFNGQRIGLIHELSRLDHVLELRSKNSAAATAYKHTLPSGYELKAAEGGVEQQLLTFIEDPKKKLDKTSWFDFDRIAFGDSSPELNLELSEGQLENLAAILNAYPKLELQLGGYSDASNPGNQRLTKARALMTKAELIRLKVAGERLHYADTDQPTCHLDDAEACRMLYGSVALRVSTK